jgi:hypothetical protein
MREENSPAVQVGATIWTDDSKQLGIVSETLGDYMRIQPESGTSYWLPLACVEGGGGDRPTVEFRHGDLQSHIVTPPDNYEESVHIDPSIAAVDEEHQREAMLREIAEQRRRMEETGAATAEADRTIGEPVEQELQRLATEDEQYGQELGRRAG